MKATYIRTEYVTMCAIDTEEELVEMIVEEVSDSIRKEELMKEFGISLDDIFGSNL